MNIAELRAEVQRLRDAHYEVACDLESEGKPGSERAFGRVDAFDTVLRLIDEAVA
jgi:hypothetical protein